MVPALVCLKIYCVSLELLDLELAPLLRGLEDAPDMLDQHLGVAIRQRSRQAWTSAADVQT
jgi:hypothetical protein